MGSLLVGKKAPAFKAKAACNGKIISDFSLDLFCGKQIILFFYPLDFTFVCPTEIQAFQDNLQEFESRDTQVVGCSVDSAFCHLAWMNTPRNQGGIDGVTYPLVADLNKEIARAYHVLKEDEGIAFRGLFLIDKEGIIRHQLVNDLALGRSVDEAIRLVDAWIFHKEHGEVCPANWRKGEKSMKPTKEGLVGYFN
ncbi:MAG: peroxiredoxin [Chlamydiota bacterium]